MTITGKAPELANLNDEVDLRDATIFCDSAAGVYIPQRFAREVRRELVTGVSSKDYEVLEAGPDHEHYWDAWADVLDNALINDPVRGECHLHQDQDLWVVPTENRRIMGYWFHPMTQEDWDGFAGADAGSWIHHCSDGRTILIYSPQSGLLSEIVVKDDGLSAEILWTPQQITSQGR
jgi:hypothetical protein